MSGADSYVHAHSDVNQLVKKTPPGARLQEVNGTAAMAYLLAHMPRRDLMLLFGRTLEFTGFLFENVRLALRVCPSRTSACVRVPTAELQLPLHKNIVCVKIVPDLPHAHLCLSSNVTVTGWCDRARWGSAPSVWLSGGYVCNASRSPAHPPARPPARPTITAGSACRGMSSSTACCRTRCSTRSVTSTGTAAASSTGSRAGARQRTPPPVSPSPACLSLSGRQVRKIPISTCRRTPYPVPCLSLPCPSAITVTVPLSTCMVHQLLLQ